MFFNDNEIEMNYETSTLSTNIMKIIHKVWVQYSFTHNIKIYNDSGVKGTIDIYDIHYT